MPFFLLMSFPYAGTIPNVMKDRYLESIGGVSMDRKSKGNKVGCAGLIFDDNFEAGNLGSVRSISDFEYEICLRPDTNAPKYRLWFYFRVTFDQANSVFTSKQDGEHRAVFSIVNFSKNRSLYRDGMAPLVRSTSRPLWERVPRRNVFYFRSAKHKAAFVMSFVFTFDKCDDEYYFAYSYPFTYTEQQKILAQIEAQRLPYVRRDLLCRSVQGRRVDMITVGDINPLSPAFRSFDGKKRRTIVIVGRVHPGETPASFVLKGLLDFLTSSTDRDAERLRRAVTFILVPMLNPDGCFLGNYRTCSLGIDHNRRWTYPTQAMEPSLQAVKHLLADLYRKSDVQVDFFIDIHAHSTARSAFVLCNPPPRHLSATGPNNSSSGSGNHNSRMNGPNSNSSKHNAYTNGTMASGENCISQDVLRSIHLSDISAWPRIIANSVKEFSLGACKLCTDPSKAGCARRVLGGDFPDIVCYTLEISFYAAPMNNGSALTSQMYKPIAHQSRDRDYVSNGVNTNGSASANGTVQPGCPNTEKGYIEFGKQVGLSFMTYYKITRAR